MWRLFLYSHYITSFYDLQQSILCIFNFQSIPLAMISSSEYSLKPCPYVGHESMELLPHTYVTSTLDEDSTPTGYIASDSYWMGGWEDCRGTI